jgi:PIN domain nuclease of toxin-antitoxin system
VTALLDTHSFLWFIAGDSRLSETARRFIADPQNTVLVSTASLWEIAIKVSIGKLALAQPYGELIPQQLERQRIGVLGVELPHLAAVATLPLHHRDPFDRLIIAQALTESVPVVSIDGAFDAYSVRRIW